MRKQSAKLIFNRVVEEVEAVDKLRLETVLKH